jgi:hypothetical protein
MVATLSRRVNRERCASVHAEALLAGMVQTDAATATDTDAEPGTATDTGTSPETDKAHNRGSTPSLSIANTPNTHSCTL